ncbi:MAG: hypothetical protein M1839_005841, partial [Geoglossum umbratile]
ALASSTSTLVTPSGSTSTPGSTAAVPSPTGPGGVIIECPAVDNTTYSPPNSSRRFLRQCDTNWGSAEGAIDATTATVTNMVDCISLCAKYNDQDAAYKCAGVTWVYAGLQGTSNNYCWIKSKLGEKTFVSNMESAILLS